ncbi:hypothetical protein SASPL_107567 [Salvia splendens]|uniref:MBD domain-containing protein n=1 Tax=Salvia splendens TaxID=180675 RepID=A0A8X8YGE7_SALSN|nr:hypothetical protein SASPL_107567 [Salvia splendens]
MDGERPEWLPVDWKVCVRARSSGRKDRYYVSPSNSKLDVETIGKSKLLASTEMNNSGNLNKHEEASTNFPLEDVSSAEENECDEKKLKSSLNDLVMDPCIEFAIKTLTGAIPIEDVNKMHEASPIQVIYGPILVLSSG